MGGHTLKRNAEGVPDFLSGRGFSRQEIQEIQETVRVCWRLSWKELVQTICEHMEWVTPAGRNKLASCAKALQQLEALGLVKLPRLCASKQRKGARAIVVGAGSAAEEEIAGTVREVGPVEVQPVGGKEAMQLWNEYVHRYHPLGYKRPFGAHQRYFLVGRGGRRLGETRGRGRMDRHTRYLSTPRAIYVYPLVPEFRAFLQGASGEGQGQR